MNGIYIYCNLINGKKYIGKSVNIEKRIKQHSTNDKYQIHKAIKKYGIENFYVIKIEYLKEQLNELEKYYIKFFDSFKSGYNGNHGGGRYGPMNAATKNKIRNKALGKKASNETKRKLSEMRKGNNNSMFGNGHKLAGESNGKSKITEDLVLEMRKMHKDGIKRRDIIEKYKHLISYSGIGKIIYNKTWKHL